MPIDWKALLVGVGVGFSSFVVVGVVSEWASVLPIGSTVEAAAPNPGVRSLLLVTVGVFPGALAAGYLHGPRLAGGVLYGIAAGVVGFVVPAVALIYLFAGLIGVLSGELGVLLVVTVPLALAIPIVAGEVAVIGAVGGLLGATLRRRRSAAPG